MARTDYVYLRGLLLDTFRNVHDAAETLHVKSNSSTKVYRDIALYIRYFEFRLDLTEGVFDNGQTSAAYQKVIRDLLLFFEEHIKVSSISKACHPNEAPTGC